MPLEPTGLKDETQPLFFVRETRLEDVRDLIYHGLLHGQKFSEFSDLRKLVSQMRVFGLTVMLEDKLVAIILWRPDKNVVRIVFTWGHSKFPTVLQETLVVLPQTLPVQFKAAMVCLNEDALELCNTFKGAGFKSLKVLPNIFDGRDGIIFIKAREEVNGGTISDQDLGQGDGPVPNGSPT